MPLGRAAYIPNGEMGAVNSSYGRRSSLNRCQSRKQCVDSEKKWEKVTGCILSAAKNRKEKGEL